jgi:hypothetical protein
MNNILDFEEKDNYPIEANKSIKLLVAGLGCYFVLFAFVRLIARFDPENILFVSLILIIGVVAFGLTIIGLISGVKSIIKREKSIFKKYFGLIGNLIFVLIMGAILFANAIDLFRYMQ